MVTEQSNILVVMVDQLAAPFLSAYGGPAITPAIDWLAREGVVFSSAYSNSPLCAPARFSMMTGQLAHKIGAYDNASELASSVPTFAHHLRRAGYQTSLVGKMHFVGPDQLHGFEERLTTDIYPADFGWTPSWDDPDHRFDWWFHNLDSVVQAGVADATNQLDYDDDVGAHGVRKIRDLARSNDDRPWMVCVSFTHPHDPYVARQRFWDLYDHDAVPMPKVGPLAPADLDPHSIRLRHVIGADETEPTDEQVRNARHAYLANCSYVDEWIGRLLETLDHHGMADDTTIIFTSDHGDMLGERGLWYKMCFFEHACRVPLIIHQPSRYEARRVDTQTSLLDIAPTLLDLAGLEPPDTMDGASVLPFAAGHDDPDRTVPGEFLGEGAIAPIFMLRRGDLKFVWSEPDGPQLFNLADDPDELVDRARDPTHASVVAALTAEVGERWDPAAIRADVIASQNDRRLIDGALRLGRHQSWDHQPVVDASERYMRNHLDLNDVEAMRRSG
ncbi:MAG: choline-sulfatase [Actinomycetia bacterium]|nr:choline-sulfatase [Actinomycetes bacterium]MCP3910346.1 choline-sulfatase [Actinomycetes bacterium]MCP4086636.1 choline-sulfatase [Actinomycetes bacterium]